MGRTSEGCALPPVADASGRSSDGMMRPCPGQGAAPADLVIHDG